MNNQKKVKIVKLKPNFNYGGYDRSIWLHKTKADEHIDSLPCDTEPKDD
tara:strand:- start:852 stop:998 length:147 start_codon:yes stop_codon:yes gene_type:complete